MFVAMAIMVIGGTAIDTIHKKSAQWFFENDKKGKANAKKTLTSSDMRSIALKTATSEILTSSEFANPQRRTSHLFTMLRVLSSSSSPQPQWCSSIQHLPPLLPQSGLCFGILVPCLWLLVDIGSGSSFGSTFLQKENPGTSLNGPICSSSPFSPWQTFGLIWSFLQSNNVAGWETLFLALFIGASTVLFSTVLWSKFAHMFFKPAAAFQKRVTKADGSRENLPELADRSNPADRE